MEATVGALGRGDNPPHHGDEIYGECKGGWVILTGVNNRLGCDAFVLEQSNPANKLSDRIDNCRSIGYTNLGMMEQVA